MRSQNMDIIIQERRNNQLGYQINTWYTQGGELRIKVQYFHYKSGRKWKGGMCDKDSICISQDPEFIKRIIGNSPSHKPPAHDGAAWKN